jgi:hypothetical protein
MITPALAAKPKFVIQVARLSRPSAVQTVLDHEYSIQRRRAVGPAYDRMCALLTRLTGGKMTRGTLLRLAEELATARGIRVDRTAKRMKDCLICWFCERAGDLATKPLRELPIAVPDREVDFPSLLLDEFENPDLFRDPDFAWEFATTDNT